MVHVAAVVVAQVAGKTSGQPYLLRLNKFGYVNGNPLGAVDPEGLVAPALAPLAPVVVQICRQAAMQAGGALANMLAWNVIFEIKECDDDKCKENTKCDPPEGTVCYMIDRVPPSKPHYPIEGSHYHLWVMNQSPSGSCFWNKLGASRSAPPGAVPCPFQRPKR